MDQRQGTQRPAPFSYAQETTYSGTAPRQQTGGYPGPVGDSRRNGLKDWQQDVWEGPVPTASNPFDEPEDAPELLSERSENLNNRKGEFWKQQTAGYQVTQEKPEEDNENGTDKRKWSRKYAKNLAVASALLILAAIAVILRLTVFSVQQIEVIGNSTVSASEIVRLSGVHKGDFILTVGDDQISQGLSRNRYVILKYVEKELPGKVTICVKEREACCWMTYCGIMYAMDKNRIILEEGEDPNIVPPQNLVKVTGLNIRSGCMTGQTLILNSEEQEKLFTELFLEMKVTGCITKVEEVNMADPDSVLMTMRNGVTVKLGDRTRIHAKLRALILTMAELENMGHSGGIINVSSPESPVYSPESL